MANLWNLPSGATITTLLERVTTSIELPLAAGLIDPSVIVISGSLPGGMRLTATRIEGTPFQVARDEVSTFVLRATDQNSFEDRTFSIIVAGPDSPVWLTPEGLLPVGSNGLFFILDSSPIDFQLSAIDEDISAGDELEFYIANDGGILPPGLSLSVDGRISGIVDPILALDKTSGTGFFDSNKYDAYPFDYGVRSANGYDSFFYDTEFYDFSVATQSPRKLNRFYEFIVTVSDGDTTSDRTFKIYVVGDDFVRADNTIMQVGTGLFTADNTYVRTPIWLTPGNLGFRRANNYVTLFLDTLQQPEVEGSIIYSLDLENDDASLSELPPGMTLDSASGEVYGRVPYQPAVTREFKFTVTATRHVTDVNEVEIIAIVNRDTLLGSNTIRVNKLPLISEDGIENDLQEFVGRNVRIENNLYLVQAAVDSNSEYDVLTVTPTLSPVFPLVLAETAPIGQQYSFVNTLTEQQKLKLSGKTLRFSNSEEYVVNTITSFLTWQISYSDGSEPVTTAVNGFPTADWNIDSNNVLFLRIPATTVNRNKEAIRTLFDPSTGATVNLEITANFDRLDFQTVLGRTLVQGQNIGIGAFKDTAFSAKFISGVVDDTQRPTKAKTFTLNLLGEIDSTISWISDAVIGEVSANLLSTFKVQATTTVPDATVLYRIVDGRLPSGLRLSLSGEIIGRVRQFPEGNLLGLTTIDGGTNTTDGGETTLDRSFQFTVEAADRFRFSASTKEFTINVVDPNDLQYSNLYLRPYFRDAQRTEYNILTSNSDVFPLNLVYRINDPEFGIQTRIQALAYAGIETKDISEYVAVAAKNHKKRRYKFGEIKTAVAKEPGSDETIYEVVYVELIDPALPKSGKLTSQVSINNSASITADSVQYDSSSDSRSNTEEPFRYRPNNSTIKADSDAVKVSGANDVTRYISNIQVMRERIATVGDTDRRFLPLWMRTAQGINLQAIGYTLAVPICYTKIGGASQVKLNIEQSGFDFKNLDMTIDRYVVDSTTETPGEQYILFANYQFNV